MRLREPTPIQRAALGAALLPAPGCLEAWDRLRELTNNLDAMDAATFRTLPMVYRNLKDAGVEEAELGPLKGIYRQGWYRNRLVVAAGLRAIATLRGAGVEPIVLKGLGLIATAYPEPALRPMDDVDVLVAPAEARQAASALLEAGWRPSRGTRKDFSRRSRVFHAMPLVADDGIEVDLHRAMLEENVSAAVDAPAFARKVAASFEGVSLTTLSPEDHVLNACVHGGRWDWVPSLRWILDVVMIVRASGDLDWGYLVQEARRREATVALAAALDLAREYEPSIPAVVIDDLRRAKPGRMERWDFRAQQAPDSIPVLAARNVTRYLHMASRRSLGRKILDFPVYLEWVWGLDNPRQIPGDAFRRVLARLRSGRAAPPGPITAAK